MIFYIYYIIFLLLITVTQQIQWKKIHQNFVSENSKYEEQWNIGNYNYYQPCDQGPTTLMKIAINDYIYTQLQVPDHKKVKIQFNLYSINSQNIENSIQQSILDHFYVFIDKQRNQEIQRNQLNIRTINHQCKLNDYITRKKSIELIFDHSSRYLEIDFGNIIDESILKELQINELYLWGINHLNIYVDDISENEELLEGDFIQNFFQLRKLQNDKESRRQLKSSTANNSHSGSDSDNNGTTSSSNANSSNQWHHSSNENSSGSDSNNDGTTDSSGPGNNSSNENSSGSDSNGDGTTDSSGAASSSHELSSDSDSNGDGNTDSSNGGNSAEHTSSHEASSGSDSNGDGNSDSSLGQGSSSGEASSGSDSNHDGNSDSSGQNGSSGENSSGSDSNGDGNTDSSNGQGSSYEDSSGSDSNGDGDSDSSGPNGVSSGEISSGSDSDGDGNTDSSGELSSFSQESNSDSNNDGDTDSSQGQGSSGELSSGSDSNGDGDSDSSGPNGVSSGEVSNTHSGSDSNGDGDTDSSSPPEGNSSGEISSGSDTNGDGNTDTSQGQGSSGEQSSGSDSNLDGFTDSSGSQSSGEIDISCSDDEIEYGDTCYTDDGLQNCFDYFQEILNDNSLIENTCTAHKINDEYTYTLHVNYTDPFTHNETCSDQRVLFQGQELPEGDATLNYDEWTFDPVNQHLKFQIKHKDLIDIYQCTYNEVVKDGKQMYVWICDIDIELYFGGILQYTYSFKMCAYLDRTVDDIVNVEVYQNSVIGECCENRLGVESTLKFCTDETCNTYIDTSLIPYTIERLDIVTVEHSITTTEFVDYYLWAQQIRFGPFVPEVIYYDGSQKARNIIQFVANVAVDSMQIEVISLLNEYPTNGISTTNTLPQSRRRNLVTPEQRKQVGYDYKIKSIEYINVEDPEFDNILKMKQEEKQEEQEIKQNQVIITVMASVTGIVLLSILISVFYCRYLFKSRQAKLLKQDIENQDSNNKNILVNSKGSEIIIQTKKNSDEIISDNKDSVRRSSISSQDSNLIQQQILELQRKQQELAEKQKQQRSKIKRKNAKSPSTQPLHHKEININIKN